MCQCAITARAARTALPDSSLRKAGVSGSSIHATAVLRMYLLAKVADARGQVEYPLSWCRPELGEQLHDMCGLFSVENMWRRENS